eukprot:2203508-Pyramimonas_sp.AAC.1
MLRPCICILLFQKSCRRAFGASWPPRLELAVVDGRDAKRVATGEIRRRSARPDPSPLHTSLPCPRN